MLTDFLTDLQVSRTEDSSVVEFTEEKEAETFYEVLIMDEVDREDSNMECGFEKSSSDLDNKHQAVKEIIDEFLSTEDEEDNDSEISESEHVYIKESLEEGYKVLQLENFYYNSILENAPSESPQDLDNVYRESLEELENADYNWDLHSELISEYESGEDQRKMLSNAGTSEEEFEVSDFHEESHAALQAEKMYELLTVNETMLEIPKESMDDNIDISKMTFQQNKTNSYIDDIYFDMKSKKEKSSKLMTFIEDVYEEMKDDKVFKDRANTVDYQIEAKNSFLSYGNNVNDHLKADNDDSSKDQEKLISPDTMMNDEEWVLSEGMESIEENKEATEQETTYSV
eukprot:TRINITY_DN1473_c0_g1_i2.p1 TRINITY_DN1473_c0_g1~~TRINITY_DN1473_c0_g1_i2.p1  ORF type:complete len:343 (-),score=107.90 TRINITY_DN1473_c0_g1_i2:157-1185(-)